jgi:hypothetical protein
LVLAAEGTEDEGRRAGRRHPDHPIVVSPHPPDGEAKNHAIV